MGYPTDYLDGPCSADEVEEIAKVQSFLAKRNLVATQKSPAMGGLISRVRIDAYGRSASEVEATLLEFAGRCDSASQRPSCSYGECVIERNLVEQWGDEYSWRGRFTIHPDIGEVESSQRAAEVLASE